MPNKYVNFLNKLKAKENEENLKLLDNDLVAAKEEEYSTDKVKKEVETLTSFITEYVDNPKKSISKEEYKNLISYMNSAFSAIANCYGYVSAHSANTNNMAKEMKNFALDLQNDIAEFASVNYNEDLTYEKLLNPNKEYEIDVDLSSYNVEGGCLSNRINIKTTIGGQKVNGYFTQEKVFSPLDMLKDSIKNMENKYPQFKDFTDNLLNKINAEENPSKDYARDFSKALNYKVIHRSSRDFHFDDSEDWADLYIEAYERLDANAARMIEEKQNDPAFQRFIQIFSYQMYLVDNGIRCNSYICENGDNINQRNSAMSAVANLIGASDVVAQSVGMKIKHNDQVTNGTFMYTVEGKDATKYNINDFRYGLTQKAYSNETILKKISDLQIVDYICGNFDRHNGNYLLKFAKVNDEPMAIEVKGIDNDMAFNCKRPEEQYSRYATSMNIHFIDRKTSERILALDEQVLRATLSKKEFKLPSGSVKEAVSRLHSLKTMILMNAVEYNPDYDIKGATQFISVLDDKDWKNFDYTSVKDQSCLMGRYARLTQYFKNKTRIKQMHNTKTTLNELDVEVAHLSLMGYAENAIEELKDAKAFLSNSTEYKNIISSLEDLIKLDKTFDNTLLSNDEFLKTIQTCTITIDNAQKYLDYKNKQLEDGKKEKSTYDHDDKSKRKIKVTEKVIQNLSKYMERLNESFNLYFKDELYFEKQQALSGKPLEEVPELNEENKVNESEKDKSKVDPVKNVKNIVNEEDNDSFLEKINNLKGNNVEIIDNNIPENFENIDLNLEQQNQSRTKGHINENDVDIFESDEPESSKQQEITIIEKSLEK